MHLVEVVKLEVIREHYRRVREGLGSQSLVICVGKYSGGES